MMYHNPRAVVQVNGRRSRPFAIERSVRQGCPLSPLLYVLAFEPLLRRLRDEGENPTLRDVSFADPLTATVSAFADDITVFVSRRLDIKSVKKAVAEYERIAGAKVNFDKSECLELDAWRCSDTQPRSFRWSNRPVCILGVWFVLDLQLASKLVGGTGEGGCSGGNLASKEVVLKGQGGGVAPSTSSP